MRRNLLSRSDHPEARALITTILKEFICTGWRYFKIDFAYTVSDNRAKFDRSKTSFETLRSQWQLFREALGEDALINACIGGFTATPSELRTLPGSEVI